MAKETIICRNAINMNISSEKMEMYLALAMLEKENLRLIKNELEGSCEIQMFDKKDNLLFSTTLVFPLEENIEIVLMGLITNSEQDNDLIESNGKRKTKHKNRKKKERKKIVIPKKLVVIGVTIFLFVLSGWGILASGIFEKHEEITSWEEYVQDGKYIEADEEYPEKIVELVDFLTDKEEFTVLEEVNSKHPSDAGNFELAFYHKQWEKVVETEGIPLTNEKKIMLAYAYIQLGNLDEAEIINKAIQSDFLDTEIHQSYKSKAIYLLQEGDIAGSEKIQTKINDEDVADLIVTAKTCEEMIDFYSKEKDSENKLIWEKRLNTLGEEFLINENE